MRRHLPRAQELPKLDQRRKKADSSVVGGVCGLSRGRKKKQRCTNVCMHVRMYVCMWMMQGQVMSMFTMSWLGDESHGLPQAARFLCP